MIFAPASSICIASAPTGRRRQALRGSRPHSSRYRSAAAAPPTPDHDQFKLGHLRGLAARPQPPDRPPSSSRRAARASSTYVDDHGDDLVIRTDTDRAEDFKIVTAPVAAPSDWRDLVAYRENIQVESVVTRNGWMARTEMENGHQRIVIRDLKRRQRAYGRLRRGSVRALDIAAVRVRRTCHSGRLQFSDDAASKSTITTWRHAR